MKAWTDHISTTKVSGTAECQQFESTAPYMSMGKGRATRGPARMIDVYRLKRIQQHKTLIRSTYYTYLRITAVLLDTCSCTRMSRTRSALRRFLPPRARTSSTSYMTRPSHSPLLTFYQKQVHISPRNLQTVITVAFVLENLLSIVKSSRWTHHYPPS